VPWPAAAAVADVSSKNRRRADAAKKPFYKE
jgi:hypothetical protein